MSSEPATKCKSVCSVQKSKTYPPQTGVTLKFLEKIIVQKRGIPKKTQELCLRRRLIPQFKTKHIYALAKAPKDC